MAGKKRIFYGEMLEVLLYEVQYHKDTAGSSGFGDVWEKGFMSGLRHAIGLLKKLPRASEKGE